jgi:sterol desaturase/sphingolipid hydroxylase (fatty acid hydroxylase superfamily)
MSGLLRDTVASASARDLVMAATYVLVAAVVVAELCWLAARGTDRGRTREAATAIGMYVGAVAVGAAYTVVLVAVWSRLGGAAPGVLVRTWRSHPVVSFVTAFVAWDGAGFAYHAVGHRTRVGWAAHQPHHSGTRFNITLALRQSWMPWHGLLIYPWLALGGWSFATIAVCAAVSNAWQALEHSRAPLRVPPWFAATFMTPEAHRHHHRLGADPVNLGPVLTLWDRAWGSWVAGPVPEGSSYGLEVGSSTKLMAVQLAGWRALMRGNADDRHRSEEVRV